MDHATKGFFQDILHHPSPIRRKKAIIKPPVGMVYGWAYHIRNSGKRLRSYGKIQTLFLFLVRRRVKKGSLAKKNP